MTPSAMADDFGLGEGGRYEGLIRAYTQKAPLNHRFATEPKVPPQKESNFSVASLFAFLPRVAFSLFSAK
jgi:hypothetical protein